ncbi:hypothetical protein G6F32_015180 [Rhizopus arrhizus]|nr:hypothetical protein G6F32_015180 [Rhizopus arrhizus]
MATGQLRGLEPGFCPRRAAPGAAGLLQGGRVLDGMPMAAGRRDAPRSGGGIRQGGEAGAGVLRDVGQGLIHAAFAHQAARQQRAQAVPIGDLMLHHPVVEALVVELREAGRGGRHG